MKIRKTKNLACKEIINILKENRAILRKYKVKRLGLFGSFARRAQKRRSDIDFLVEFEETTFDNFMSTVFFLESLFDREVDLITRDSLSPYIRPYVEKEVMWCET